jgi:hypothetical protein
MKKLLLTGLAISTLFATDYTAMSLEELQSLKGTVPVEERTAFQAAMQEKVQGLTPDERSSLGIGKNRFNENNGQGDMNRLRDGSGIGNNYEGLLSGGTNRGYGNSVGGSSGRGNGGGGKGR